MDEGVRQELHLTQCDKVLRHLRDYGSITTMQAFTWYGITRLASRIYDLRQMGHDFERTFETSKNRYGEKVTYCRYTLKEEI